MANYIPKRNSGGIPGFNFMSELADLVTTRLTSQVAAVNTVWDKVTSEDQYDLRAYTRDLARMWERGFGMVEDLVTFPLRYQEGDRPPWFSLVWDRKTQPDTAQGEIILPKRLDIGDEKLSTTRLERLGPDQKQAIDQKDVEASLDGGSRLSIAIKNLQNPVRDVGHFVGFVTRPNVAQPIAIIFLTIT